MAENKSALALAVESRCKEIERECGEFLESISGDFNWWSMAMSKRNIIIVHVRWDEDDEDATFDNPTEAGVYLLPKPNVLRQNKEFCKMLRQLAKDSCCTEFEQDVDAWLVSDADSVYADNEDLVIDPQDMLDLWDKLEKLDGFEFTPISK